MYCQNPQVMKKLILLIGILFTVFGFSQPINVNSTNYTVPQLVNDVLINTSCANATNVTWSTGSNFGSTNGIGFFQNTNPNFPMQSGVILSTGNAANAAGPNNTLLSDGISAWPGDTDLENTLAAAGVSLVSKNATVLEFDFVPNSSYFSFDFLFASEEYGNFQCQFSDAFAFLLTNTATGVTTNLALVPNTNLPISVVTIRDYLYNSSCASANAQFFGSYNGGSQAATSATNFNGQTTVMTAASTLTPGVQYHIKLVIADRLDPQSDSAIFISANSLNIGQDVLGQDLTVASNSALCYGATHTISTGLNPSNFTFQWKKNNVVLTNETGPNLVVNQPGTYTVVYTNILSPCSPTTNNIVIEYLPQINAQNPNNLYKCDNGSATYTYNLDLNTSVVKTGLNANTLVTYHATQSDADNNVNALPLNYSSAPGQTIYVRIQIPNTSCYVTRSFQLLTTPGPIANQAPNLSACARGLTLNNSFFNLNAQTASVLNGQSNSIYAVSYYNSLNNANSGTNPISGNLNTVILTSGTIYVRVQTITDPTCFAISSFTVSILPVPAVDVLEPVIVCDFYELQPLTNGNYFTQANGQGTMLSAGDIIVETTTLFIYNQPNGPGTCASSSVFRITVVDPNTLSPDSVTSCGSYTLTQPQYGKYFSQPGGQGAEIPAGTVINSTQTVYFYFTTDIAPFCVVDTDFVVTIIPSVEVGTRNDIFECTSYTLPELTVGNYYTQPGGNGTQMPAGTVITSNQTIYVYATTGGTSPCNDQDSFEVFIGINQPADISQCNGYTLPALPVGNYFTAPMGGGQMIPAGTVINNSTTIYIYAQVSSDSANCTDNLSFNISIAQPEVDELEDVTVCETYTLPALINGDYYTGSGGTGTMLTAGDVITASRTLYVFKRLNATCFNQSSFVITINPLPLIDSRSDIDICDQYVLTQLQHGNYYTGPSGTGTLLPAGSVITSSQRIYIFAISNSTPACTNENSFQVNIFSTTADSSANITACDAYTLPSLSADNNYYTLPGGPYGNGTVINAGTVITTSQTIYIYKESLIRTSFSCADETSFTVTINQTPVIPAVLDVAACNSYTLRPLLVGNYFTGPNGTGTMLQAGDVVTSTQTMYIYAHTNTTPDCSSETSFNITIFNVDNVPNVTICHSYTLPALTIGNYYSGPNGTGTQLTAGTTISTTQTIYIYAVSPYLPRCADESSFTITIIDTPVANPAPVALRTVCDEDGTNDGVTSFNLTSLSSTILGTQTGNEFTIAYYESAADAANQVNAITSSTLTNVFVRVTNTLTDSCFDIKPIAIIVNRLPEPSPVGGIICYDLDTQTLINPYTMYSGLSSTTHTFVWTNEAGESVGTNTNYTAILPGTYTLVATSRATGCASEPVAVVVTPSEPAEISYTVDDDFQDLQSITVTATGQGDYEYQLDNGNFQDSPVFEDVTSGMHLITVRDKNGCGVSTLVAVVINYPKYFTPNGDGYHDTWNIRDLRNQPSAVVTIYDRYGKILTQIKPNGNGWDGTYNGNMMPSDDYWFSVTYMDENQVNQEFRSHFAMKR